MKKECLFLLGLAFTLGTGCSQVENSSPSVLHLKSVPVIEKLRAQIKANATGISRARSKSITYLADFSSPSEAQAHRAQVVAQGGTVQNLNDDGRVQSATVLEARLESVRVPQNTVVSLNAVFRIHSPGPQETERSAAGDRTAMIQEALAARKITGVEALTSRFPKADGRGLKVAVFDTGIDFGVEGISTPDQDGQNKLVGFYDFTNFGKVSPTSLTDSTPQSTYMIDLDHSLTFDPAIAPQKIQAIGILDLQVLARSYYASDLNFDGKDGPTQRYAYAVGINQDGIPAVWIDINSDGKISSRKTEELTDFNSTKRHIDIRPDVAPSGAKGLAVSIASPTEIQFHHVSEGHGTSCAAIIAGHHYADGHLVGMAPKAQLISYLLDASGQDVYTLEHLVKSFEHAKSQGVVGISISYGFSTGDLTSAQFLADYLDKEIASAGIVIGIAAGNEGPGISSASAVDYIPHHGFGIGAQLSKDQAESTYGWIGAQDSVVYYSSHGPTRGGRQMPDIVSPLVTWVRGERNIGGDSFYGFSGTSSATPAFVGATTALISALKQNGEDRIDIRLLKLAIQNTAQTLETPPIPEAIRQGAGLVRVDRAYDLYKRLLAEQKAAESDSQKRTRFPYELRASTSLWNQSEMGEGIHAFHFVTSSEIQITMTDSTSTLVDPLITVEPLILSHESDFFQAPKVLPLQAGGARFSIQFNPNIKNQPGIYSDVISLKRPSDSLTLLTIPVVVEIPFSESEADRELQIPLHKELNPQDVWRAPVRLSKASAIEFHGLISQQKSGLSSILTFDVYAENGLKIYSQRSAIERQPHPMRLQTPTLQPGNYQLTLSRNFPRPAVLSPIQIDGEFHLPAIQVIETQLGNETLDISLNPRANLSVAKASLTIDTKLVEVKLQKKTDGNRIFGSPAFIGHVQLDQEYSSCGISLAQTDMDRYLQSMMNVSMALESQDKTLYRGWINLHQKNSTPSSTLRWSSKAESLDVIAYPNVMDWKNEKLQDLNLQLMLPFKEKIVLQANLGSGGAPVEKWSPHRPVRIQFQPEAETFRKLKGTSGTLILKDAEDQILGQVRVRIN